ncbi:MAG: hypothetical protein J1E00_00760 [Oscillospiraceae bacterium]|nr:hypothetical protein [Oscillospiraceae bacterium]
MAENTHWNKKVFAILLERAKGVRSWRQFAAECGISYVQMRKLASMSQENPPRPKLIRKVTDNAFNDVDLEDLLFAAGMSNSGRQRVRKQAEQPQEETAYDRFRALPARDRRIVEEYIDFLTQKRLSQTAASKQQKKPNQKKQ